MWHQLKGAGLGNVFLLGGITVAGEGDDQAITYSDLDGLYKEIARAISRRSNTLTAQELRFLRKRLAMSQADVGALGGKSEQAAAKWEKGTLPVPQAEARLVRLAVLHKFGTNAEVTQAIKLFTAEQSPPQFPYVFRHTPAGWREDRIAAMTSAHDESSLQMTKAVAEAMQTSAYEVKYTSSTASVLDRPRMISL